MAKAYLGKISALVTANTSDFNSKLNASAKEVRSFASSMQSALTRAESSATSSLRGIYTEAQKLERALKAVGTLRLSFKGFDASQFRTLNEAADQMRRIASAAELIYKPLQTAAKATESLSAEVRGEFQPALIAAQRQAELLNTALTRGLAVSENGFAAVERRVNSTAAAIGRLREASQAVGGLATGQELRFQRPDFVAETQRAAALQSQITQLSPQQISSGGFAELVSQQRAAAAESERLAAALERVRLSRGGDVASATAAYDAQIVRQRQLNDQIEREIILAGEAAAASSRRAAAASMLLQVNQSESTLLSNQGAASTADATGRSIQQRLQDIARLREAESALAREREIAANIGASSQLASTTDATGRSIQQRLRDIAALREAEAALSREREISDNVGASSQRATQLPNNYFSDNLARSARESLGAPLGDATSQLERFRSGIVAAKNQLESMPEAVRSHFIPAIRGAEQEFVRLRARGPRATADEIENAVQRMNTLTAAVRRATQASAIPSFGDFINDASVRQSVGELQALQQVLIQVGATAGGPAAQAYERYRQRLQAAITAGETGLPRVRQELVALQREAATAAAATGRISFGTAMRRITRGGDVARGGFDNLSLAVNQAAFAIDDFFSSTGGLEFRLRAVSNNITQLAFILGGTRGLFIGLAAVIGGQLAVAITKWVNGGRTAEDQAKALNDALSRQKSLVEELAKAFESLGDSIANRAFSQPAQEARRFAKELGDIAKKQKELRESRVADLDADVQRERAEQARIGRELETETDGGRRVALQGQLRESRRRERERVEQVASATPPTRDELLRTVLGTIRANEFLEGGSLTRRSSEQARVRARRAEEEFAGADSVFDQARLLRERIAERQDTAARPLSVLAFEENPEILRAREDVAALSKALASLELPLQRALDALSNEILKSSYGIASAIGSAQEDVADAIRRGVRGAADFQAALDNTARQLDEAQQRLRDAQEIEDPARREQEVRRAEREVADIRFRREAINERAREVRLGRTFGGERTTSALSALQGNERFANEYAGLTARLTEAVDAELAARRELEQAIAGGDAAAQEEARSRLEAAQAAGDVAAALAEAAVAIEGALSRLRKIADNALSASEQIADDAQRRLTENPTNENRRARDDAERQLIEDRRRVAEANNAISFQRSQALRDDPRLRAINTELEQIKQERERLAEDARINNREADPAAMRELADREARLQAEREQRLYELTEAERRQADAIAWEIDARRRLIEQLERERQFDEEQMRIRNPVGDPSRGRDLSETPEQRLQRETRQSLADINAYFDELQRATLDRVNGLPDDATRREMQATEKDRRDAIDRFFDNKMRQEAPTIMGLADSVQNAVLNGPSRAALTVSDATTVQGQQELNRLLRGDDANRNQDMVALQREANRLLELIAEKENPVAQ